MDELITFITARVAETKSQSAAGWPTANMLKDIYSLSPEIGHTPGLLLAVAVAVEKIAAEHARLNDSIWCRTCDPAGESGDSAAWYPCQTARLLGAIWNDHPDYRQEWAPAA